jgi:hypothetical protein
MVDGLCMFRDALPPRLMLACRIWRRSSWRGEGSQDPTQWSVIYSLVGVKHKPPKYQDVRELEQHGMGNIGRTWIDALTIQNTVEYIMSLLLNS